MGKAKGAKRSGANAAVQPVKAKTAAKKVVKAARSIQPNKGIKAKASISKVAGPNAQSGPRIFFNDLQKAQAGGNKKSAPGAQRSQAPSRKSTVATVKVSSTGQRVSLGGRGVPPPASLKPSGVGKIGVSLKTAEAISRDHSHPNRAEVHELLKTFERGWIDGNKFTSLLARYIA